MQAHSGLQKPPLAKHSQYSLRHLERLQWQRSGRAMGVKVSDSWVGGTFLEFYCCGDSDPLRLRIVDVFVPPKSGLAISSFDELCFSIAFLTLLFSFSVAFWRDLALTPTCCALAAPLPVLTAACFAAATLLPEDYFFAPSFKTVDVLRLLGMVVLRCAGLLFCYPDIFLSAPPALPYFVSLTREAFC